MKYLITGGLGFIGSKIIEKLSNEGHSIQCIDNKDTYDILTKEQLDTLIKWRTRNWKNDKVAYLSSLSPQAAKHTPTGASFAAPR